MRPNFINTHNQENASFTLNKTFMPPYPFSIWYYKFYVPFILMYY